MKIIYTLIIVAFCSVAAYSQTASRTSGGGGKTQIVISDNARFEIANLSGIQLPVVIKLDRYTGKTFQYAADRRRWFLIEVRGGLPDERGSQTPKYQIADEGDLVFLINNETGQTWIFNVRTWEPVID